MLDTFHARQSAGGPTHRNQDAGRYLWAVVASALLAAHAVERVDDLVHGGLAQGGDVGPVLAQVVHVGLLRHET